MKYGRMSCDKINYYISLYLKLLIKPAA